MVLVPKKIENHACLNFVFSNYENKQVRYSKNPRVRTYFFRVWQNRFFIGVLTGNLG